MTKILHTARGEIAGFWDVVEWIVYNYPTDIFVMEQPQWCEIRDRARAILIKRLDNKKFKQEQETKNEQTDTKTNG